MNVAVRLGRWTTTSAGLLLLCILVAPAHAAGNIWESTFGQRWFSESRSGTNEVLAGTWWEASLTPGNTYKITFEVARLNGRAKLLVGGRSAIDINRTGWHSYDFKIWEGGNKRRMIFTTGSNNTSMGVRKITVAPKWDSGTTTSTSTGNSMPRGHYLAFSSERNLKTQMLDLIDNPRTATNWHLNMAYEIKNALQTPGIKGFMVLINWKTLEIGDGKFDWRLMDANMAAARRLGLKYIVQVATRSFDGTNILPKYFPSQYVLWTSNARSSGVVAKLWDPYVYNRLIRLYKAIANRYGGDAAFGGIGTSETALGNFAGGNYSYWAYRNALIKIATQTQSVLKNSRLFMYMNFLRGGDNYDMRQDGRLSVVKSIPHHAVAMGGPDITPDQPGMPGSLSGYRIHLRKNYPQVEQFCHAMHVDQGKAGINRKRNDTRRSFFDLVKRVREREQRPSYTRPKAIFEFDDLRAPNGTKVNYHPDAVVGKLWAPSETFAFAKRNFACDYFIWNFRGSNYAGTSGFLWEDIRPVVVNNQNL